MYLWRQYYHPVVSRISVIQKIVKRVFYSKDTQTIVASVTIVATTIATATQHVQKLPIKFGVELAFISYLYLFAFGYYKLRTLTQSKLYISCINVKCQ